MMVKGAILSPCRNYRYVLERRWGDGPLVLFIGLNPSTADETEDDPTIRRCIRFARDWYYGGLLMGNLFAYRTVNPFELSRAEDPIGPDNDAWLAILNLRAGLTVAAWGAHKAAGPRAERILPLLGTVYALGVTKDGSPRHPLYMPVDSKPTRWSTP